jgi:hypothetical protein
MLIQSSDEIAVGTILGETHRLLHLIGRGGRETVWEARHLRLPKRVPVKVLLERAASAGGVELELPPLQ